MKEIIGTLQLSGGGGGFYPECLDKEQIKPNGNIASRTNERQQQDQRELNVDDVDEEEEHVVDEPDCQCIIEGKRERERESEQTG